MTELLQLTGDAPWQVWVGGVSLIASMYYVANLTYRILKDKVWNEDETD